MRRLCQYHYREYLPLGVFIYGVHLYNGWRQEVNIIVIQGGRKTRPSRLLFPYITIERLTDSGEMNDVSFEKYGTLTRGLAVKIAVFVVAVLLSSMTE